MVMTCQKHSRTAATCVLLWGRNFYSRDELDVKTTLCASAACWTKFYALKPLPTLHQCNLRIFHSWFTAYLVGLTWQNCACSCVCVSSLQIHVDQHGNEREGASRCSTSLFRIGDVSTIRVAPYRRFIN